MDESPVFRPRCTFRPCSASSYYAVTCFAVEGAHPCAQNTPMARDATRNRPSRNALPMKRRLLALTILAGIVATGVAVTVTRRRESHRRQIAAREEYYKAALQSYTKSFTLGLTRKVVEANLSRQGVTFRQQCCIQE